jgi:hypothetical protein
MNELSVTVNNTQLPVKEHQNQRVVTLKEIDAVHQRPEGTAKRNFSENRERFIEGVDYFNITSSQKDEFRTLEIPNRGLTLITESGYLMLVKSFTDDLAWEVQRQLVNTYFRAHQMATNLGALSPQLQLLINIELSQKEQARAIAEVNQRVDDIRDVVALSPNSWRPDARTLITRIAHAMGGNDFIRNVQSEIFKLVDERAGVSLETRLTNKRRRMADEGVCKSKRDKLNKADVIAEDKKLIEIYVAIVKEMAVKCGVTVSKEAV